jgi:ATP/maltotriose-dependent transcriptional regulator MalT
VTWCWIQALTSEDPAAAAAEAERVVETRLMDPPQLGVSFHLGLVADMLLAAGDVDRAEVVLSRAEWFLGAHGQWYAEGLLLLLRARLLLRRGEPAPVVRTATEKARAVSAERGAHLFARRAEDFLATVDRIS